MREEMHTAIDADRVRRIAELEAERDALKERNETLEAKMERAMISVAHFTQRYNDDLGIMMSLKHEQMRVEAERDQLQKTFKEISDTNDELDRENARLRQALEDAPHDLTCHSVTARHIPGLTHYETDIEDERCPRYHFKCGPCDCWKAALTGITEAAK